LHNTLDQAQKKLNQLQRLLIAEKSWRT